MFRRFDRGYYSDGDDGHNDYHPPSYHPSTCFSPPENHLLTHTDRRTFHTADLSTFAFRFPSTPQNRPIWDMYDPSGYSRDSRSARGYKTRKHSSARNLPRGYIEPPREMYGSGIESQYEQLANHYRQLVHQRQFYIQNRDLDMNFGLKPKPLQQPQMSRGDVFRNMYDRDGSAEQEAQPLKQGSETPPGYEYEDIEDERAARRYSDFNEGHEKRGMKKNSSKHDKQEPSIAPRDSSKDWNGHDLYHALTEPALPPKYEKVVNEKVEGPGSFSKIKSSLQKILPSKKAMREKLTATNLAAVQDMSALAAREVDGDGVDAVNDAATLRCPTENVAGWLGNNNRTVIDGLVGQTVLDEYDRKKAKERRAGKSK